MKKMLSYLLSIALLFTAISAMALPVGATVTDYGTLTGTVVCGDTEGFDAWVDLTEITVETSELRRYSVGSTLVHAASDERIPIAVSDEGRFTFEKETSGYWIEIDNDTLPHGYGVIERYPKAYENELTFTLRRIADIEVEYRYDTLQVRLLDADGGTLRADHEVIPDLCPWIAEMAEQVGEGRRYATKLDYIATIRKRVYTGRVVAGDVTVTYRYTEGVTRSNITGKVNTMYREGMIAEEEYIGMYCDMVMDPERYFLFSGDIIQFPHELTSYINDSFSIPPEVGEKLIEARTFWNSSENPYRPIGHYDTGLDADIRTIRAKMRLAMQIEVAVTRRSAVTQAPSGTPWAGGLHTKSN